MTDWVVAVRAAMPSPRPQAWQALQQADGLGAAGATVWLVADAARAEGVPADVSEWLGRPLRAALRVPPRAHRPPAAGLLFRAAVRRLRSSGRTLLCRDPRVAAAERGRWAAVVHEWHVPPDLGVRAHRGALRGADIHVTPAPGIAQDLVDAGVPADRLHLVPNACGLDQERGRARAERRGRGVIAVGLHRRAGLDLALDAWASTPTLPELRILGRDQGGERVEAWARRGVVGVKPVGPRWGTAREDEIDAAGVWLAAYPDDPVTRTRLCPLQVADALGAGIPLAVPDLPSVRALTDACAHVAYFAPGDPSALAAAVLRASELPVRFEARPTWADRGRALMEIAP